jgi:hypothetical protein
MSGPSEVSLRGLNDCGCCGSGLTSSTSAAITNRPGLSAIYYRVATHAEFKASMLAALSDATQPALAALTTRVDDDFSIALIDAWALVADVLAFYNERVANESYLRTATERLSMVQLARLIGYRLRPGVAAGVYLAFTVQDTPGSPATTIIGAGTKVQSIPGPNEKPQTFETAADITANVVWNKLQPRLTQPQPISTGMSSMLLSGTGLKLAKGDPLLIFAPDNPSGKLLRVSAVTEDAEKLQTSVNLVQLVAPKPQFSSFVKFGRAQFSTQAFTLNNSTVQSTILGQSWNSADLNAFATTHNLSVNDIYAVVSATYLNQPAPPGTSVFAMRKRAALFGYNAPNWQSMSQYSQGIYVNNPVVSGSISSAISGSISNSDSSIAGSVSGTFLTQSDGTFNGSLTGTLSAGAPGAFQLSLGGSNAFPPDWPFQKFVGNKGNQLCLDQVYKEIKIGDWVVVLRRPGESAVIAQITDCQEIAAAFFAISGQVTQITFDKTLVDVSLNTMDELRGTAVYIIPEQLTPADLPDPSPLPANSIQLSGPVPGLGAGQAIIISGTLTDVDGVTRSEAALIRDVTLDGGYTTLTLESDLQNSYVRSTVVIYANVALATNGETTAEILGAGDASQVYQKFTLKQPPLTYVPAANQDGAASTLQLFVNDVKWHEADNFFNAGPRDRLFVTRNSDDGQTTVTFGDGQTGARLPTGVANIRAAYRKGIGLAGNVQAGQLSLLMTRPLGVSSVTNPVAASGGADPEPLEQARLNLPLGILTLGRIVSLGDYEDFARAFAGIGKALATWTWMGQTRGILLTVAGPEGAAVTSDTLTYQQLLSAIETAGDPNVPLRLVTFQPALFRIAGSLKIDPDYQSDLVTSQVDQALQNAFSFDARSFGQAVALSEVYSVILSVAGVLAADVSALYRAEDNPALNPTLVAAFPQPGSNGSITAAELLTLDPRPLQWGVLA